MAGEFADDTREDDDAIADARRWGLSDEEIEAVRIELGSLQGGKLWAMHLDAFRALCAAGTQWRTRLAFSHAGPVERVIGLDYAALKVALDAMQICATPTSWSQLIVLERAAVAALNGEPV